MTSPVYGSPGVPINVVTFGTYTSQTVTTQTMPYSATVTATVPAAVTWVAYPVAVTNDPDDGAAGVRVPVRR